MSHKVISDKSTELQSIKDIVKTFAKETTAHGIPRIIDRKKLCAKVFWSILVSTAFGMFSFQTSNLIEHFHTSHTKIELINSQTIPFPAVTFCNLNRLKRSLLSNSSRFEEILRVESELDQLDIEVLGPEVDASEPYEEQTAQPTVISNRSKRSEEQYDWYYDSYADRSRDGDGFFVSPDLRYETVTPTWEELADLGHKAEDLILECKFNNRKCDHTDFSVSQSESYGNCFTFNGNANAVPKPTKAGSNFGLHLILFIEHYEYLGTMTDEAGIQIMTHPKNIMPHLDDVGFSLSPGFSFNMGIRQVEIKRLKNPYGNCTDGHPNDTRYLRSNSYNYSVLSCQKKCFLDELQNSCSCVTEVNEDYLDSRLCGRPDRICRQSIEMKFYSSDVPCDCPAPCHEFIYNTQTTFSLWPDAKNYHILKTRLLKNKNLSVYNMLRSTQLARENLVKVKIYFQELNYELVEQVPAYTFETVLGTTGGLLGLYIGFSLITIVETFIFLYDIIVLMCRKALLR